MKKEKIRVGYIGCGGRGRGMLEWCFAEMPDVEFAALCDWSEENMKTAAKILEDKGRPAPYCTTDYHELMADDSIDAIIIMTGWNTHVELAKASILAGKYTAVEVGCAYELQECYELIEAYEKTKAPLMMLENCCYGRREMMVLNMAKQGLFGEIAHARGAYMHYLCYENNFHEVDLGIPHYRLHDYMHRNCEQYPTHELGPISKVLGINRGNRMVKLTSVASKSIGLKDFANTLYPDTEYSKIDYKQGDIVNTLITCANGETILLTLDTTLPRPYYSRDFTVRGTRGMYTEERKVLYLEEPCKILGEPEKIKQGKAFSYTDEEAFEKYDHPLHAEYVKLGEKGGHGGMDWLVCRAFVEAVKNGTNTPIDAYDTVTWMSIASLSEMSIQRGGSVVDIPDFTKGKWFRREPAPRSRYSLDEVVTDDDTPIF